jgi:glycosyltransferase involved in cell wall biosynthesis
VINSLAGGGAERVLSILLDQFSRRAGAFDGAELHLVLLDRTDEKYRIPGDVIVHRHDSGGSRIASIRNLGMTLGAIRPDISASFLTRSNIANILAARRFGHHCVISERVNTTSHLGRGLGAWVNRLIVRHLYPRAGLVIVNSLGTRDDLSENYRVPRQRISVIPNPFDLEAIRLAARSAPDREFARPYAIAVGRLTRNKNFSLLVRAFADAGGETDLVILGEGEEHDALLSEAAAVGISDRFHLPGFVDNPYPLIAGAQYFVSSSNAEGFPNALAEAMALGKPVVATDCPSGPSELLEGSAPPGKGVCEARHGLLVPIEDQAALTAAMCQIVDPERAVQYSTAAERRMETFRANAIAAQYEAVIGSVGNWIEPALQG